MKRILRIALFVYWALLATFTHLPPIALPKTHVSDKFEHFTAYFILSLLLSLVLGFTRVTIRTTLLSIAVACAFGAIDELTQPFVNRICDLHDWYADAFGSIAGAVIVLVFKSILPSSKFAPR